MSESYTPNTPNASQNSEQTHGSYSAPAQQQPSSTETYTQQPYGQWAPVSPEGQKHSQNALLFGILGIVVSGLGLIFGPLALSQARKAESYGVEATAGKVTGWIGLGLGIIAVLFFLIYLVFIVVFIGATATSGY
ncbi:DUF4190 domain-containing protein [Rothia sp. 88186D007BW]